MVFTFTLWKSLCVMLWTSNWLMSLMCLICFIDHICYRYCLHAFSKELNERKTEKQRIVDSDGKWRPCWLYGDGVWGGQNISPYIIDLLGPFREIWEYAREISGNSQGEKMCQSVGILSEFPLVQFYGAGTVWSVLQLVSHIHSNKPNCC